jgi:hypothetical protein
MDKNHSMSAPRDAIKWWELRRIPFNAGMLVAGCATLADRSRTFRKWFIRALLITIAPGLLILARSASWKLLHAWSSEGSRVRSC